MKEECVVEHGVKTRAVFHDVPTLSPPPPRKFLYKELRKQD